jgi:hypothetical protein
MQDSPRDWLDDLPVTRPQTGTLRKAFDRMVGERESCQQRFVNR